MTSLRDLLRNEDGYEEGAESIDSYDENATNSVDPPATEPLEQGVELLASGEFGRIGLKHRTQQRNPNIVEKILKQRSRAIPVHVEEEIHSVRITRDSNSKLCYSCFQNLVPNTNGTTVANYDARVYTASFSKGFPSCLSLIELLIYSCISDSSFFYTCSQGSNLLQSTILIAGCCPR